MKKEQKRWIVDQNSRTVLESEWGVPLNTPVDFARHLTPTPQPPIWLFTFNISVRLEPLLSSPANVRPDWDGQIQILFWRWTEEFGARVAKSEVLVKSDTAQNALRQNVGVRNDDHNFYSSEFNLNHSTAGRSFDFNHLWQLRAALQNLM